MKTKQEIENRIKEINDIVEKLYLRMGVPGVNVETIKFNIQRFNNEITVLEWIIKV